MIKVLIADSDIEIIKNFQTYIKSSFPEIRNVSVTSDPRADIAETIKTARSQLILANIRFFGAGNIQKIRGIYDRFPGVRFILYGTYSDAEYLKKAMEYGAIDYMYRPIKPADLHKCLENALNYFKKADESKKKEMELINSYKEKRHLFESVFLTSLIGGKLTDETEVFYTFKYFGFGLTPGFTVFVIHVDNFKRLILTLDEMEKHLLTYKILLIAERKLRDKKSKAFIEGFNAVNVILGDVAEADGLGPLVELCEDIRKTVYDETSIHVTIGIGRTYDKAADIAVSYREAVAALRYRVHIGYNSVIHILFADPMNGITYRYPIEREQRLIYTAAIGEYEYSVRLLREIFDALKACGPLPDMYLSKVIMNILISINRTLGEQNIKIQNRFTSFFPSREVLELGDDIEEAFEYLSAAMKNFCEHIVSSRAENNRALVSGAKAYIDEKYYESYSITKVATALGTTPDYLNKIFEEQEGRNVLEYTIFVRTTEAKRLMRETKLDDSMIAVKVGYDDGRHFRSIFKKYENMSTTDYRVQYSLFSK